MHALGTEQGEYLTVFSFIVVVFVNCVFLAYYKLKVGFSMYVFLETAAYCV